MKDLSFTHQQSAPAQNQASQLTIEVGTKADQPRVQRLLAKRHYLGNTPPVGDFLIQILKRGKKMVGLAGLGRRCSETA